MTAGGILVLNAGSSSVKFALYDAEARTRLVRGRVERIGGEPALVWMQGEQREQQTLPAETDHAAAIALLLGRIEAGGAGLVAVGHRVVHGGVRYAEPQRITPEILEELQTLVPLAPLHQPHNLAAIRAVAARRPALPQVACFDTAFHRGHEEIVDRFALPRDLFDEGVRRYGFHGLSYEAIAGQLAARFPALAAGRVVVAHLGAGASLCALQRGRSVDTTMGMTALDGLPMMTRPGALDPGAVLYLFEEKRMSAVEVGDLLYNRSGLLGVSGLSADMKTLAESEDPRAAEARGLFVFRVAKETGALAAVLGGLDGLVFTAGVGEHDAAIRADIVGRSAWLGLALDAAANEVHAETITASGSRIPALVLKTDEEGVILAATAALCLG